MFKPKQWNDNTNIELEPCLQTLSNMVKRKWITQPVLTKLWILTGEKIKTPLNITRGARSIKLSLIDDGYNIDMRLSCTPENDLTMTLLNPTNHTSLMYQLSGSEKCEFMKLKAIDNFINMTNMKISFTKLRLLQFIVVNFEEILLETKGVFKNDIK